MIVLVFDINFVSDWTEMQFGLNNKKSKQKNKHQYLLKKNKTKNT